MSATMRKCLRYYVFGIILTLFIGCAEIQAADHPPATDSNISLITGLNIGGLRDAIAQPDFKKTDVEIDFIRPVYSKGSVAVYYAEIGIRMPAGHENWRGVKKLVGIAENAKGYSILTLPSESPAKISSIDGKVTFRYSYGDVDVQVDSKTGTISFKNETDKKEPDKTAP